MKKLSKTKIVILIISIIVGVVLLYGIICCGITFVPMIKVAIDNSKAYGETGEPDETISLDNGVKLYAFLDGNVRDKYVIVCPGGGYMNCAIETEGFAVATEFNRLGYASFVLEYRTGKKITSPMAPLDDLASAIAYVDKNAKKYDVYKGHYVLCGFSAGGNLIGLFGTKQYGYANYKGINAPDSLIMGYPWCAPSETSFNGNIADYIYYSSLCGNGAKAFLGSAESYQNMQVPLWIDEDYPRTFIMQGTSDTVAPAGEHSDLLDKALTDKGVDHVYKLCDKVGHGCGIGLGTAAEGWIADAMTFTYQNWYLEEYEPDPMTPIELKRKAQGFMCGVCHPNERFEQLKDLGGEWVRFDITSLPLDKDGNLTQGYLAFKERAKSYVDKGFKVFAVTPEPNVFIAYGLDPRIEANEVAIMEQLRFLATDLQDLVSAFQVMNEQTEPIFRTPLTLEESAAFMARSLKVMNRFKAKTIVGYNLSANFTAYLNLMKDYNDYSDYIGVDIYLGCFESATHSLGFVPASTWMWYVWTMTKRPVIMTEFGYISAGEPKSDEEKLEILLSYGAIGDTFEEAENYARAHISEFIQNENFPPSLRNLLINTFVDEETIASALFGGPGVGVDYRMHLYMELGVDVNLEGYPHSLQGQADYFKDYFEKVVFDTDYVCGAIFYCLNDADACGYCGQSGCPVETRWGLLDVDGNKKPSFYVVKEAFEKCKEISQEELLDYEYELMNNEDEDEDDDDE